MVKKVSYIFPWHIVLVSVFCWFLTGQATAQSATHGRKLETSKIEKPQTNRKIGKESQPENKIQNKKTKIRSVRNKENAKKVKPDHETIRFKEGTFVKKIEPEVEIPQAQGTNHPGSIETGKAAQRKETVKKQGSVYEGNIDPEKYTPKASPGPTYQGNLKVDKKDKSIVKKQGTDYGGKMDANQIGSSVPWDATLYSGDIKIKKHLEGMHPSAKYVYGKTASSLEKKGKIRQKSIRSSRKRAKDEQPPHLKEKIQKPKYDSRENKIWYD